MIFRFAPRDSAQAVADFHSVRSGDPRRWGAMPRNRRRAAVRAAWHAVERQPAEGWPEFWRAELTSRQA